MPQILDICAPILPGSSLAGLRIGSRLQSIYESLRNEAYAPSFECKLETPFFIQYQYKKAVSLTVHVLNGKLLKIGALQEYKGSLLSGVKVGMTLDEAINLEPNLVYDEEEENFFIKSAPGIAIEANNPHLRTSIIQAITVYLPALKEGWSYSMECGDW